MVVKYPQIRFVCFDALRWCASLENLQPIRHRDNFVFVRGDVCDANQLLQTMIRYSIDAVLHFAAESSVDKSINVPNQFAYTNVAGSMIVAECCEIVGVHILIHASTDEVYGENFHGSLHAFNESSPLQPTNPYSITKAVADIILRTWWKLPLIVVRSANVYGPRQYPEKLIPKLICQKLNGLKYTIHGDGLNKRCYMFVSDCTTAYEYILFHGTIGEIYNIGTDHELSNMEIVSEISQAFGVDYHEELIEFVSDRLFNDQRYWMSCTAIHQLSWRPSVPFSVGLKYTIEWYKDNLVDHWSVPIADMLTAHPL